MNIKLIYGVISLSGFALSCSSNIDDVEEIRKNYKPSTETAYNVEILFTEEGFKKVELRAPEIFRDESDGKEITEFSRGVSMIFYDDSLQETSTLVAGHAIRIKNEMKTIFTQNVRIVTKDGKIIETDELIWDEKAEMIKSDKFVKIVTPEEQIWGIGFESNQDFSDTKVKNIIKGTFNVHDEKSDEDIQ